MGTHDEFHSLGFLLTDSARHLRAAFERRIAEAGLGITPGEARTLLNVHALKDARQLEIAARMGIEPMTVCSFLDKLQAQGLIDRQPDPNDRRAKRVTLMPASEPLISRLKMEISDVLTQASIGLSPDDMDRLHHVLFTLTANLQAAATPASPEDP